MTAQWEQRDHFSSAGRDVFTLPWAEQLHVYSMLPKNSWFDFKHLPVVLYFLSFIKKDYKITDETQTFEKAFTLQLEDLLSNIIT